MSDAWRVQPWKNGGGVTREIIRWPETGNYDVRVSLAEVERDGPFSTFPGYIRWTVLVAGSIRLDEHELHDVGDLVELAGEQAIDARGCASLLNVIARAGTRVGVGRRVDPVRFVFTLDERRAFYGEGASVAWLSDRAYVWIA